jgi:putative transposase
MRRIDEQYTRRPFYGSRRMVVELRRQGLIVNRKRVQRLMREMGLETLYPKPHLSANNQQHKVYPYLLRGVVITHPDQVWSTDITYIRLHSGFWRVSKLGNIIPRKGTKNAGGVQYSRPFSM